MKKYFLAGLATLLPLAVTIYIVVIVVDLLTRPFMGFVTRLLDQIGKLTTVPEAIIRATAQISILIILFLLILLIGAVAQWFFVRSLIKFGDYIMRRIPVLNKVYKTTKQIIEILFTSKRESFKHVVMVRFPYRHCYTLGLIVREAPAACKNPDKDLKEELVSVFIPTTPNPMTGYVIVSPKSELIFLEMKGEEALKYVVSCGVIQPSTPKAI